MKNNIVIFKKGHRGPLFFLASGATAVLVSVSMVDHPAAGISFWLKLFGLALWAVAFVGALFEYLRRPKADFILLAADENGVASPVSGAASTPWARIQGCARSDAKAGYILRLFTDADDRSPNMSVATPFIDIDLAESSNPINDTERAFAFCRTRIARAQNRDEASVVRTFVTVGAPGSHRLK